jgi:hypothetical protein
MITNSRIGYNGRFGNQLFQFASTIGIGIKLGYEILFPKSNIINGLQSFNADGKPFIAKLDIVNYFDIDDKYFGDVKFDNNVVEKFFHFDEELFKINDSTNLDGFLQSEKYFEHCKSHIIDILKFKTQNLEIANELLPKKNKELVAIHIRRTDYLYLSDYHLLNGLDYVNLAINAIGGKDKYHFIICSDDTKWCKTIWGNDDNFTIINTGAPEIDFTIMSLCNHHIIANSSFSWWSSYLSKYENKKIVAPKNWFGQSAKINTKDLYTKNMIII